MVLILALSGVLVGVAMSWPIISPWLSGHASAIAIDFYNKVNLPLYILIFMLLAVAPFLSWMGPARNLGRRMAMPFLVASAATAGAMALGYPLTLAVALFFFAVMALVTSSIRLVHVGRNNMMHIGAPLAHIGFALMFVGIVGSGPWAQDETVSLPLGQPVEVHGTTLTYMGHVAGSEPQHRWRLAVGDAESGVSEREATLYKVDEPGQDASFMRKPVILRWPLEDLYLVATGIESGQGSFHELELVKGQPVMLHETQLLFKRFGRGEGDGDHAMTVTAEVDVTTESGTETILLPFAVTSDGQFAGTPVPLPGLPDSTLAIQKMSVDQGLLLVRAQEGETVPTPQTMILVAGSKPLISIMWLGTLLLGAGCMVAAVRRIREARALTSVEDEVQPKPRRRPQRIAAL